jgi:transcriptional regulator GlxA family with amidase domain
MTGRCPEYPPAVEAQLAIAICRRLAPDLCWEVFSLDPRLSRVGENVLKDPACQWTLKRVSRIGCTAESAFSRMFHQRVGVSLTQWVRLVRVGHALVLLGATDMTIPDVATRVGFRSERTLQRAFKDVIGQSARSIKYGKRAESAENRVS